MRAQNRSIVRALTLGGMAVCLAAGPVPVPGAAAHDLATSHAGPPAGIVPANAHARAGSPPGSVPLLTYHGGPVMASGAVVRAIYWGPSWANASFVDDKITGLTAFYNGIGRSTYAGTNTEYAQADGAHVSDGVNQGTNVIDTSASPRRAPSTAAVLAEVAKTISNPVANGYYPVYVDTPRRHTGYCAWHSYGTIGSVTVQFAFFFNLDGDPGCDPQDTTSGHSQGLAALANVSGHELSEALTDPHLDAWYDSSGAENSDKCAWSFGPGLLSFGASSWKIQGNWSNAAYASRSGYDGSGCIDGG
jgi:hypothetical protein